MSYRVAIVGAWAFLSSAAAFPVAASAQEVPPQAAALQQLVGTWSGTGTIAGGEEPMTLQMTLACESVSDGFGVLCRDESVMPAVGTVHAIHLFGYDPGDGLVHWFSVTSQGETHDHKGGWVDNTMTLMHSGPMEGQLFTERITIAFDGETATGTSTMQLGGQLLGELTMTMTRASAE